MIARGLDAYRAGPDRAASITALHHLLERQHYKLGHWRLASSDINYRRFFDVNTLAGMRVEDLGTFEATHRLVKRLVAEGKLQGLRLDHIDGLRDPAQYFQRLRRLIRDAQGKNSGPFYMVVEKILGEGERLPAFSGVDGTTGYEWLNVITRVLVDAKGLEPLDEVWRQVSNQSPALDPVLKAAKRRVLETLLTSEFTVLSRLLARIAAGHYSTRDFSADSLRQALALYVAALSGLSHLSFGCRRGGDRPRSDYGNDRKGARRLVCRGRRHLRLPARRIDDGSGRARTQSAQQAAGAPLRAEGAAVHGAGDGEVARGYRVLPPSPPARAQ